MSIYRRSMVMRIYRTSSRAEFRSRQKRSHEDNQNRHRRSTTPQLLPFRFSHLQLQRHIRLKMGAELSLMAPTASSIAISAYVDVLDQIQYRKQIGASRFLKMIKANDPNGAVVVKVFIKPNEGLKLDFWKDALNKLHRKLADVPSVLTYSKIIDTERAGYLIRQYIKTNVYDRISTRPFLESVEKRWIAFQLLSALSECHSRGVTHGDIKTENILVTSWNWILLSDFAPFKPIYLPEDNPGTFSFYFDTSQRRICYLAPERFLSNDENEIGKSDTVTPEMDIFSLGCAIAEIFLEGSPIFTLSQLYKYKRGEYTPDISGLTDPHVKSMVLSMISLDPKDRLTADEYLTKYRDSVFPDSFYNFFYEYFKSFNEISSYNVKGSGQECDVRINRLFNDYDKISYFLGYEYSAPEVSSELDESTIDGAIPLNLSLPGVPPRYKLQSTSKLMGNADDISLIVLTLVFTSLRNCREESSRLRGLELILALSERIHDEGKLDRCLPYIMTMLNDPAYNVQSAALLTLTQLLLLVDAIGPVNVLIFPDYIKPRLLSMLSKASPYVRITFATCLPYLAQTSLRFYEMATILKSSVLETSFDPETEIGGLTSTGMLDLSKVGLYDDFERFATIILTDSESTVKIALLKNLLPLCSFFGKEKSNDLILSHLITYLNDKDPLLRIAFVEAVTGLAIYVGTTSLEHYILPLLVQTLSDPEELVVIKVLHTFHDLLKLGLVRKGFVWDFLAMVSKLLLHPNEWIRQGSLILVVTIAEQQSLADLYCMLYPIIRPYFEYDATDFSWNTLYSVCKRPLSRSVYNLACTWSLRAENTLFWKPVNKSSTNVFGNRGLDFVSSSSTGKSEKVYSIKFGHLEIPLSQEDKSWNDRLVSSGLSEQELWKIADLREYIYRVSRLTFRSNNKDYELGNLHLQQLGVLPKNVFFDSKFHTHSFSQDSIDEQNYLDSIDDRLVEESFSEPLSAEVSTNNTVMPALSEDFTKSLILGKSKAAPSIMANEENAYAELESSIHRARRSSSQAKKFKASSEPTLVVTNSYKGKDNYIIRFLNSVSLEPDLEEFQEFNYKVQSTECQISSNWSPTGDLVSHLKEHKSGINSIDVSPDHSFFVTGDESGSLKVWDTARLERNVSHSSMLSIELESSITHIKFLRGYNCFGVSTKDGHVRVLSVDYNPSKKLSKSISGLTIIRETKLENQFLIDFSFGHRDHKSFLFGVSSSSEVVGIDIRSMRVDFILQNNPSHGIITSFTIDPLDSWLLIGTSKGVLDFWDLRFKVLLRTWKFRHGSPIKKMESCSNDFQINRKKGRYVTVVGGTGDSDACIFDVSTGNTIEIFTRFSSKSGFDDYSVIEVSESDIIDEISAEKNKEEDRDRAFTALHLIETQGEGKKKFWILTAAPSYELVLWDVYEPEESKTILASGISDGKSGEKRTPTYSSSQINPTLKIVSEKMKIDSDSPEKIKRRKKNRGLMSEEQDQLIKGHHDIITDFAILSKPYEMIVAVDRAGVVNVYK